MLPAQNNAARSPSSTRGVLQFSGAFHLWASAGTYRLMPGSIDGLRLGGGLNRPDRNRPAMKLHDPFAQCEQGVVTPTTDILARLERGAALAYENRPELRVLAAAELHAAELRVAVATVARFEP